MQPKRDPIPPFPGVITPNPGGTQLGSVEPLHGQQHLVFLANGFEDGVRRNGRERVLNP